MDTLRNCELNGLLTVKRRHNGSRVYSEEDREQMKIIRSLRCVNDSLASILRVCNALDCNPCADIKHVIDAWGGRRDHFRL